MIDRAELKAKGKANIQGNIWKLFLCSLILIACSTGLQCIPVVGTIASLFVSPAFSLGVCVIYIGVSYGNEVRLEDLFVRFPIIVKAFCLNFLVMLFTGLWSLLLIVPGVIKSISYSMSYYILAENPEMSAMDALEASKVMMDGHKMDYFMLGVSFIPWMLLTVVTCGIAGIYTIPYITATTTNFYNAVKNAPSVLDN